MITALIFSGLFFLPVNADAKSLHMHSNRLVWLRITFIFNLTPVFLPNLPNYIPDHHSLELMQEE